MTNHPTKQPSSYPTNSRPRPVRVSEQTKRAFNIIISYRSRHHIAAELEPLKLGQDDDDDEDEHDSTICICLWPIATPPVACLLGSRNEQHLEAICLSLLYLPVLACF